MEIDKKLPASSESKSCAFYLLQASILLYFRNFPANQSPHRSNKLSSSGQVEEMYLINLIESVQK